ncbi:MAG: hypothetical protein NT077_04495 [Candidatus Taylorbacteria bacterium]|nr:hypothetical protein [Candidatus Taylorbacteria bacterium]
MYPEFSVPGVDPRLTPYLFGAGNFPYYCLMVEKFQEDVCGFCTIDPTVNRVLPFPNDSWLVFENTVSTRGGSSAQEHQFVIPLKRHIDDISRLSPSEWLDLYDLIREINRDYNITGGVIVIRSGDPLKNAKSMEHFHVNYHVPTGKERVQVWLAKSEEDLKKKVVILRVFEKMRVLKKHGASNFFELLDPDERELVKDLMTSEGRC